MSSSTSPSRPPPEAVVALSGRHCGLDPSPGAEAEAERGAQPREGPTDETTARTLRAVVKPTPGATTIQRQAANVGGGRDVTYLSDQELRTESDLSTAWVDAHDPNDPAFSQMQSYADQLAAERSRRQAAGPAARPARVPAASPELAAFVAQVDTELAELEPLVGGIEANVRSNPEEVTLRMVRDVAARVRGERATVADTAQLPGGPPALGADVARFQQLEARIGTALTAAERWHADHAAGESLGMWNQRQWNSLTQTGTEQWQKGGWHVAGSAGAYAGAGGVAFLEGAEWLLSFGFHDAATAVAQAYAAGAISWNEGERVLWSAAWRALLTAAITRGAGFAAGRIGAVVARGAGLVPEATAFGLVSGGVSGGLTSAATLAAQSLITAVRFRFASPTAEAIWNQGMPRGGDWVVAVPVGMILGGVSGVSSVQLRNAGLIGTELNTPGGRARIVAITPDGNMVLQSVESVRPPRTPPPPTEVTLVYDPETGSWARPSARQAAGPILQPAGPQTPPRAAGSIQSVAPAAGRPPPVPAAVGGLPVPAQIVPTSHPPAAGQSPRLLAPPGPRGALPGLPAPRALLPAEASQLQRLSVATIPGISAPEVAAIGRLSPAAWDRVLSYARSNDNVFSVKGKLAEELFQTTDEFAALRERAVARAAAQGIPASGVSFTQDIRGLTPTARTAGSTGELTDGVFFASVPGGRIRFLAVIESKSPSNLRELARRPGEWIGQVEWDFERMREVPTIVGGTKYEPSQVDVSRRDTEWLGVAPPGEGLSSGMLAQVRSAVPTFTLVQGPVRDAVLNELARRAIAQVKTASTPVAVPPKSGSTPP